MQWHKIDPYKGIDVNYPKSILLTAPLLPADTNVTLKGAMLWIDVYLTAYATMNQTWWQFPNEYSYRHVNGIPIEDR